MYARFVAKAKRRSHFNDAPLAKSTITAAPRVNAPTGPLTNLHARNQSCGTISTAGVETETNTKGAWNLSLGLAHQKKRDGDMSLKTRLPISSESLKFNMVVTKRGFTSTGRRDSAGRAVAQILEWITDVIIMGRARSHVLVTFAGWVHLSLKEFTRSRAHRGWALPSGVAQILGLSMLAWQRCLRLCVQ